MRPGGPLICPLLASGPRTAPTARSSPGTAGAEAWAMHRTASAPGEGPTDLAPVIRALDALLGELRDALDDDDASAYGTRDASASRRPSSTTSPDASIACSATCECAS